MSEGKDFEEQIKDSCEKTPFLFLRLKDGAKWVQGQGSSFTPSNICDAVFHTMPFMWLLELKSTKSASMAFNPYLMCNDEVVSAPWMKPLNEKTNYIIKPSQVRELMKATKANKNGVIAGFLLNFRPRSLKSGDTENQVYFVHVSDFAEFAKTTRKSSINEQDCASIGIYLGSIKRKVTYRYDILEFLDRAIPILINKGYISKEGLSQTRDWLNRIIGVN